MPQTDLIVLMVLGGLFAALGTVALLWGRKEEKDYYEAISARPDVREYMERLPERPEPGGLRAGGIIAIVIGLAMLLMGGAFWLWG
jgi:hypothetical protein